MTRITRMKKEIIHEELSGKIIGAEMEVLNDFKPGLDEKLCERALVIELRRRGHTVDAISQLDLALLLNFKNARLEWKRVVRQNKLESDLHA
jgi:hypothetical protein